MIKNRHAILALLTGLNFLNYIDRAVVAAVVDPMQTELGLSKKEIRNAMPALYSVIEGERRGLPLFDSMFLLGRDRTLARLRAARDRLA